MHSPLCASTARQRTSAGLPVPAASWPRADRERLKAAHLAPCHPLLYACRFAVSSPGDRNGRRFGKDRFRPVRSGGAHRHHLAVFEQSPRDRLELVATGLALQISFAALVLLVPGGREVFDALGKGFVKVLSFVNAGSDFIFGNLMNIDSYGFIFAFQVLPTIIFFSALMGVLYHLGVMQVVVRAMAWAITKVMRVSGAETTSVCASVFIGQTEAPLTVRPYIPKMTQSELLTMMIGGMAHIAGGVLAAYVGMLGGSDPAQQAFYAKHLLAASIMAAPATLVVAKLLMPETVTPLTRGTVKMEVEKTTSNVIDAAAAGAGDGLRLALNIGAMLLAFIALIALINAPLTWLGDVTGAAALLSRPTNLSTIFGYVLAPIAG